MRSVQVRVVYLVSTLRRAGPASQLLNIVRYLDRQALDPVIVTLSPEPVSSMINSFREAGIAVRSMSMSRVRAAFHRGWQSDIERLVGDRLDRRTVIHSHGIRGDIIASTRLTSWSRVATAHNYPHHDYVMQFGPVLGRWMAHAHLRAFRTLPVVVACSATISKLLHSHGIASTLIRNGVDTSKFHAPSLTERSQLRTQLEVDRRACVGVCVGALTALKDSLQIVRAVKAVRNPSLRMIFAGSGPLDDRCRREANGDERIRLVGQIADVTQVLRAADFFVSASRSEGLPTAVLEAIACGVRVYLSDIGPHREILDLAPGAGELFSAGDQRAMIAAIDRAASQARSGTAPAPWRFADLFGAKSMSQRYQDLYLRLAEEPVGS